MADENPPIKYVPGVFCFVFSCLDYVKELLTLLHDNPNIQVGEHIPEDVENLEVFDVDTERVETT